MPPVIASVVTAAGISGSIGGLSIASLIGEGVTLGGLIAAGRLMQARQPYQTAGQMDTTKQSIPPRVKVYGTVKIGGALYFQAAPYIFTKAIYLCEGPIDSVQQIWLGNSWTTYPAGAPFGIAGVYPWYWLITFDVQLGTIPQSKNPGLSGWGYSWWDDTHAGNGLANIVMNCDLPWDPEKYFSKYYPNGIPPLRAVINGSLIYDPRDGTQSWTNPSTWKFNDNPALCILDFLTSRHGYNIPNSRIDIASFIALADVCDVRVLRYDGAWEDAYNCWGSYQLNEEPRAVLQKLLMTCDGELLQKGDGTISIRGGSWTAPSVTITSDMILAYDIQAGPDKMRMFNQYRTHYTGNIWLDFQLVEGFVYDDIVAQAANGGQVIAQDLELPYVPSDWQALRLAKIYMAQNNPQWILTITATIAALDALGERIVTVELDELGINTTFLVTKFDIAGDLKSCTIQLSSITPDAYDMPPSNTLGYSVTNLTPNVVVPNIAALTITEIDTTINGQPAAQLQATVPPPVDQSFTLHAQISSDGGATWVDMAPNGFYSSISGYLTSGTYEVRAAFRSVFGIDGTFSAPISKTISVANTIGIVTQNLMNNISMDYGPASETIFFSDDFGLASSAATVTIDMGLASA